MTNGSSLINGVIEATEFAEKLPERINKILDKVGSNSLEVTVHAIDEKVLITGFQKIANRITLGLILASLIIGASMLMNVRTRFEIYGYPGLAIICFMAAAAVGFYLVVETLWSDHKSIK
jgi:ubiquinone biosynthesis protein